MARVIVALLVTRTWSGSGRAVPSISRYRRHASTCEGCVSAGLGLLFISENIDRDRDLFPCQRVDRQSGRVADAPEEVAIAVSPLVFLALDDGGKGLAGLGLHSRPANVGVGGRLLGGVGGGVDRGIIEIVHQILVGRSPRLRWDSRGCESRESSSKGTGRGGEAAVRGWQAGSLAGGQCG